MPGRAGGGAGAGHPISRAHSGGAGGRTPPCHLAFTLSHRKPRGFCAGSTRPRVGTEESTARKVGEPRAGAGGESGKGRARGRLLAQPPQILTAPGPSTPSGGAEQADPPAGLAALNLDLPGVALASRDLWSRFPWQRSWCAPLLSLPSCSVCSYFLGLLLLRGFLKKNSKNYFISLLLDVKMIGKKERRL